MFIAAVVIRSSVSISFAYLPQNSKLLRKEKNPHQSVHTLRIDLSCFSIDLFFNSNWNGASRKKFWYSVFL